ncbi:uncharacterized protein BO97DRAFT_114298 [Aspergillus homomorphus CBS 101889]|uniref:Uncharacterized protein n=1 Tax=Aspergillus homomorphus (strain CBS 101889) TaxID=1450537 RepID=A0A395HTU3_ASPHC|nr:hypothetical protein BO97DRAFT_114298 [Aspergillus homomorphus CBS 101889]RAL10833.1 hypothetical protein BO97DRAFT_114298 [Aspergillus homomorphus CBS 101889]
MCFALDILQALAGRHGIHGSRHAWDVSDNAQSPPGTGWHDTRFLHCSLTFPLRSMKARILCGSCPRGGNCHITGLLDDRDMTHLHCGSLVVYQQALGNYRQGCRFINAACETALDPFGTCAATLSVGCHSIFPSFSP